MDKQLKYIDNGENEKIGSTKQLANFQNRLHQLGNGQNH